MNVEGKKILIIGAGKSGIAAAELLLAKKAVPVLFEKKNKTCFCFSFLNNFFLIQKLIFFQEQNETI